MGIGSCEDSHSITKCIGIPSSEQVRQISSGDNHTLVLCASGAVYATGSNSKGQLVIEDLKGNSSSFFHLPLPKRVEKVGCGWEFSVLLFEDSTITVFGSLSEFQPTTKALDLFCGIKSFALLECTTRLHLFQETGINLLEFEEPIKKVALSFSHCFILLESGKLKVHGKEKRFHLLETVQEFEFDDILDVSVGWNHVILTRKHNELSFLVGFGRNDFGQLGTEPFIRTVSTPLSIPIDIESQNVIASCGSEHTLFLLEDKVYVCGWNEHGNCAFSPLEETSANCLRELRPILNKCLLVQGGCGTSFFLLQ